MRITTCQGRQQQCRHTHHALSAVVQQAHNACECARLDNVVTPGQPLGESSTTDEFAERVGCILSDPRVLAAQQEGQRHHAAGCKNGRCSAVGCLVCYCTQGGGCCPLRTFAALLHQPHKRMHRAGVYHVLRPRLTIIYHIEERLRCLCLHLAAAVAQQPHQGRDATSICHCCTATVAFFRDCAQSRRCPRLRHSAPALQLAHEAADVVCLLGAQGWPAWRGRGQADAAGARRGPGFANTTCLAVGFGSVRFVIDRLQTELMNAQRGEIT